MSEELLLELVRQVPALLVLAYLVTLGVRLTEKANETLRKLGEIVGGNTEVMKEVLRSLRK